MFFISYSMISTRIYMIFCGPINSRPTGMPEIQNILLYPIINLKDTFFEPAVGSPPNFARMCGYRPY